MQYAHSHLGMAARSVVAPAASASVAAAPITLLDYIPRSEHVSYGRFFSGLMKKAACFLCQLLHEGAGCTAAWSAHGDAVAVQLPPVYSDSDSVISKGKSAVAAH